MLALMPSVEVLLESVTFLDDEALSAENVELLLANLPSEEEQDMLRKAKSALEENEAWDLPEEFMMKLIEIPKYGVRIRVWWFLNSFETVYSTLTGAVTDVTNACICVLHSERVKRLLALIVHVGNYLNGGTPRGCADGFDIDTLGKLGTLRASKRDVGGNLVDYIARQIDRDFPGMLSEMFEANQEYELVNRARKHRAGDLRSEVTTVLTQAAWYGQELPTELQSRRDQVNHRIEQLRDLNAAFDVMSDSYASLCAWFHTDKMRHTDEFFNIWHEFLSDVKKSLDGSERTRREARLRRSSSLPRSSLGKPETRTTRRCKSTGGTLSRPSLVEAEVLMPGDGSVAILELKCGNSGDVQVQEEPVTVAQNTV